MTRHLVALAVLEEVVPEGRRAALRPQRHSHLREDGGAAVVHVGHVRQPRRDAVAGAEALERVLLLALFRIIIWAIKLRRLSTYFTVFVITLANDDRQTVTDSMCRVVVYSLDKFKNFERCTYFIFH